MFSKNKKIDSWVKKVDKIVTWIIIWSALASIFWLSQTKRGREVTAEIKAQITPSIKKTSSNAISVFWKIIAFFVWIFSKK